MKGIAHFISGIAVATFIPDAVHRAADGSLILVLGGFFALLPDTLDFRFSRYLENLDEEIDPHPHDVQPQAVAYRVAKVIRKAFETGASKTIKLHTARLSVDRWRAYRLRFNPEVREVIVQVGPIVDTSGAPLPGSEPTDGFEGRAPFDVPLIDTYDDEVKVDVFSGPSFRFERDRDAVRVTFLPWHRSWSHSLVLAVTIGLVLTVLLGPTAGWVSGLGFAIHIMEDQLGHLGSNLFWPISARRSGGLALLHSGAGLPNFLTVWLAVALILFNLDHFSAAPRLPAAPYLAVVVLVPSLVIGALYWWGQRRETVVSTEVVGQGEILSEAEESEF